MAEKAPIATTAGFTATELADIDSFDAALALIGEKMGGTVVNSSDLGDGFSLLGTNDKGQLVGVPLVVMSVTFSEGEYVRADGSGQKIKGTFATLRIVTKDGRKLILNDGSTGICAQLQELYERRPAVAGQPILCAKGLRVSEYVHPEHGAAKTYYLDTSAS